jgi:hypothetical protein
MGSMDQAERLRRALELQQKDKDDMDRIFWLMLHGGRTPLDACKTVIGCNDMFLSHDTENGLLRASRSVDDEQVLQQESFIDRRRDCS